MAPPGRPNTSVTPSASRQRMMASAPVMRPVRCALSTGDHLTVRVSLELRGTARVVGERVAYRLADLPCGVGTAAQHLVGGGDAGPQHLVHGADDGAADVAAAEAVREHHRD